MKTSGYILGPVILSVVICCVFRLPVRQQPVSPAKIHIETEACQGSTTHPVSYDDYYFIPENQTLEIVISIAGSP